MLRDYQIEPVQQVNDLLAAGTATVLVSPTGAGKTVMAAEVVAWAVEQGMRVLFLAHRKELLKQARAALEAHGLHADDRVTIMGIGRALRHGPDHVDLLVIDEAHRAAAKTYKAVIAKYPDAKRLGLTATPERTDGRGLDDVFSTMVQTPGLRALIDAGHLCDFRMVSAKHTDILELERIRRKAGDFDRAELGRVMNVPKLVGPIVEHWGELAMAENRPTVVFAVSRYHALSICEAFTKAGVSAEVLDAESTRDQRDTAKQRLTDGTIQVLVTVDLYLDGIDCPAVSCIIHARPTTSLIVWLQSLGRGMRNHPGKTDLLILDHAGNFHRHGDDPKGFPDYEHNWSLQGELERKRLEKEKRRGERDLEMAELAAELEEKKQRYYTAVQCANLIGCLPGSVWAWMKYRGITVVGKGTSSRYPKDDVDAVLLALDKTYSAAECAELIGRSIRHTSSWLKRRGIPGVGKGRSLRYPKDAVNALLQQNAKHYTVAQCADLTGVKHEIVGRWLKARGIVGIGVSTSRRYPKGDVDRVISGRLKAA